MTEFSLSYQEALRHEVDAALDAATRFGDGCPPRLADAIRYSLLAPGKRLRPLLVLLACEMLAGNRQHALPAACAVEMIHTYSLIHDDLPAMDDDDLRRGRPTCHKKFDEPTAILAGDALLPLAFEMIGQLEPPKLVGQCCRDLAVASGPCQLVGGQMDDVAIEKGIGDWRTAPEASRELMERIHLRKTGALMRVSLRLGGLIAGATAEISKQQLDFLDEFGVAFGLAFQITDDLLDELGDEATVGKRLRKDARKNKWSYPTLLGVDTARAEAKFFVQKSVDALHHFSSQNNAAYQTLVQMTEHLLKRQM